MLNLPSPACKNHCPHYFSYILVNCLLAQTGLTQLHYEVCCHRDSCLAIFPKYLHFSHAAFLMSPLPFNIHAKPLQEKQPWSLHNPHFTCMLGKRFIMSRNNVKARLHDIISICKLAFSNHIKGGIDRVVIKCVLIHTWQYFFSCS